MNILFISAILLLLMAVLMIIFPRINYRVRPLGLCEGKLPKNKPNWVSSMVAKTDNHYINPLKIEALAILTENIRQKIPELQLVQSDARHILGYRQSKFFHLTHWIYIQVDGHVESSSTLGYFDLGANRALVEKIRSI